jgi:hypothetical protein
MDEQKLVIIIKHVPYSMLKKFTLCHVFEVTTVLHQTHTAVALHDVSNAPQDSAVSLSDFMCNILFHYVTCA